MKALLKKATMSLLVLGTLLSLQTGFAQIPLLPGRVIGGTVTAVSADQATIKTIANETYTILFAPGTTFFKQKGNSFSMSPAKVTDIHVGGSINLMGKFDPDGTTNHATNVMLLTAEMSQKILASTGGRGITDVMGKVTAINGNKFTLEDRDKSSQVIEVNDQTEVYKGLGVEVAQHLRSPAGTPPPAGVETLKLTDIKLGDSLYAKGAPKFPPTVALKDNIFLATRMATMPTRPGPGTPGATPKQ